MKSKQQPPSSGARRFDDDAARTVPLARVKPGRPKTAKRRRIVVWALAGVVVFGAGAVGLAAMGSGSGDDLVSVDPADEPGWVSVTTKGVVMDVPADWAIRPDTTPDGAPVQRAQYKLGYCAGDPDSIRADAYTLDSYDSPDPAKATDIYLQAVTGKVEESQGSSVAFDQGEDDSRELPGGGHQVSRRISIPGAEGCVPPEVLVLIRAVPNGEYGSYVFISTFDQEVSDAVPQETIDAIASSLRGTE